MDALPEFEVVRPKTLDALIAARAAHPQSSLLGGGTDLIVNIRRGIVVILRRGSSSGLCHFPEAETTRKA
jgi:xanthine dehydrogenase iron-sulfur cluster and FAD-binding subunit A